MGMRFFLVCMLGVVACNWDKEQANMGFFETGQSADLILGAIGFNQSGGPLLFNHPKGIATDGSVFMLADGNNNRVLLWDELPTANVEPSIVLGQPGVIRSCFLEHYILCC